MKKMLVEFSPTDSFFNVVPVIVKMDVKDRVLRQQLIDVQVRITLFTTSL